MAVVTGMQQVYLAPILASWGPGSKGCSISTATWLPGASGWVSQWVDTSIDG